MQKTPMEYLMDFFLNLINVVTNAVKKIATAAYEARKKKNKEDDLNEKVDINKSKRQQKKIPKEIEKQMSKDNMDITVEAFDKLSKSEQKKYRSEWNALTDAEKETRRQKFIEKQMPVLRDTVNKYFQSQAEGKKEVSDLLPQDDMNITRAKWNSLSKKDREYYKNEWDKLPEEDKKFMRDEFMKKQQPLIDAAVKKAMPEIYQKVTDDMGQISLFANREQLVPKRVANQMAMEIYDAKGNLSAILPVSQAEWEKMNGAQRNNMLNSWSKFSPEEQRARLSAFEKDAMPKIQQAWDDYSKSTGDMMTGPVQVYTLDAKSRLDAFDREQAQKKMSEKERQKDELQTQKLDGKQNVEQEKKEMEKPADTVTVGETTEPETVQTTQKDPNQQSFGGKRRENTQFNQQLNEQVNNLTEEKEQDKNLFKAQDQLKKNAGQIENDVQGKEIWKDEDEREEFREQVRKGAEKREQDAAKEITEQKSMNKDNNVLDGNRVLGQN
ncbi:MAG: hypothetical protein K6G16_01545 [Lachnospiraceae bacterium]|nr:hypothetical protein [Lachnospiraceae bacterium]